MEQWQVCLWELHAGHDGKEQKSSQLSCWVHDMKPWSGVQAPDNSVLTRAVMMTEANNKINKISISYMSTMLS